MRVSGEYRWDDGSSVTFDIDDTLDSFDPIRLADMRREIVTVLRELTDEPAHPEP